MSLQRYVMTRLALLPPMALGVLATAFLILKLAPGEPLLARYDDLEPASRAVLETRLSERYALAEPLHVQFGAFLRRVATLDLRYLADDRSVTADLVDALTVTVWINLAALLVIYTCAVPLGIAASGNGRVSRALAAALVLVYGVPAFWVAEILRHTASRLGGAAWLPVMGMHTDGMVAVSTSEWLVDLGRHLVLPLLCLSYASIAFVAQQLRAGLLQVRSMPFVRALRARGASERRIWARHILPNALTPTLTTMAHALPFLVSGSVVIETIFNLPGMGRLAMHGMLHREYDLVLGVLVLSSTLTLLGTLLLDLAYAWMNPRVRFSEHGA